MPLVLPRAKGALVPLFSIIVGVGAVMTLQTSTALASAVCPTGLVTEYSGSIAQWDNCATDPLADLRLLTRPSPLNAADFNPAVSPDGSKVSLTRHFWTDDTDAIVVVSVATGAETQLIHFDTTVPSGQLASSTWSPDSAQVAISHGDPAGGTLHRANADGTGLTQVASLAMSRTGLAWCGSKLVVPYEYGLASLNPADGSGLSQLTLGGFTFASVADPVCTPDGQNVLFGGSLPDTHLSDIFEVPLGGGTATRLTSDDGNSHPAVAADGTLAYNHQAGSYPDTTVRVRLQSLGSNTTSEGPSGALNPAFALNGNSTPPPPNDDTVKHDAAGDSYSAGLGTGTYDPGSVDPSRFSTCYRSPFAYGPLLNQRAKLGKMKFFACAGAVTDDFYVTNPDNPNEPSQLSQIDPDATYITLTVSGNDAGFVHLVTKCVDGPRPAGTPQEDQGSYGCSKVKALQNDVAARLAALTGHPTGALLVGRPIHPLVQLYKDIAARAKNAHIIVGGYPRLFGSSAKNYEPQKGAPSGQACQVGFTTVTKLGVTIPVFYRVDYYDALWLDRLANQLNGTIQQAVTEAKAAGVHITYVPPSRFNGHGLCDRETAWVHGLDIVTSPQQAPAPWSFHPTYTGQSSGYEPAFQAALN